MRCKLQFRKGHAGAHQLAQPLLGPVQVPDHAAELPAPGSVGSRDVGGIAAVGTTGVEQQAMPVPGREALPVAMLVVQRRAVAVGRHDGRVGQFIVLLAAGGEKDQAHFEFAAASREGLADSPVAGEAEGCCHLDAGHFPGGLEGAVVVQVSKQGLGIQRPRK